jgi:hypothetical protein
MQFTVDDDRMTTHPSKSQTVAIRRRVRNGARYRFEPVIYDQLDAPYGVRAGILKIGDIVRVKNCPGCPPANTMGMAHIETLAGEFAGLVFTNSLQPLTR